MLIWILEVLLTLALLWFIDSIGLKGSCLIMGAAYTIYAICLRMTFVGILSSLLYGVILGVIAYFVAKLLLILIDIFGSIIYFLIIAAIILAVIGIFL